MTGGVFITFEGVEGAGKSTQIELAVKELEAAGHQVLVTREPGGSPLAERIRSLILDEQGDPPVGRAEMFLLQAARAQHVDKVIRPALAAGRVVVCDRFCDSTIAYQVFARGLPEEPTRQAILFAMDGLQPDLTLVLDMDPEAGLARQTERNRMEAEALEFHQRVRAGFQEQARREPQRVRLVDAFGSVEEVHARVMRELNALIQQKPAGSLR